MTVILDYDLLAIQEMREAVKKAKIAQYQFMSYSQEQVDRIVKAVAEAAYRKSYDLAVLAVEETGMGVIEHKKIKNEVGSKAVYEWIKDERTVGIIREDKEKKMLEIAVPFGVIAAIIPTTNPTSTAIFKTLIALKTRNAIVASPHPSAVNCTIEALKICEKAAREAGAPEGIIGWLSYKSMEATNVLMTNPDTHLILATGGSGLVRAAYSSGKPAYGVGPGNVPVYIHKTATVEKAVSMIVDSKSFDNGTICASEQAIVTDKSVYSSVLRELKYNGAYVLNEEEKKRMEIVISPSSGKINPAIVGKSPAFIARLAGIEVKESTRLLIGEETEIGKDIPFSMEKLSPVFALYKADDTQHAKEICQNLLNLGGRGHTFSIHTEDDQIVKEFSLDLPVSRILVNTLSSIGAVGGTTGLAPSMTLGCGSFGGNITGDNITATHLINIKRVAYGIKEVSIPKKETIPSLEHRLNLEDETKKIVYRVISEMEKSNKIDADDISELVNSVMMKLTN